MNKQILYIFICGLIGSLFYYFTRPIHRNSFHQASGYSEYREIKTTNSSLGEVVKMTPPKKQPEKLKRQNQKIPSPKTQVTRKTLEEFLEEYTEPYDDKGNIYITSVVLLGGKALAHGDIIISDAHEVLESQQTGKPLILAPSDLWTKGRIPYEIESSIPEVQLREIKSSLLAFNYSTNIEFIERDNQEDYIVFTAADDHCYSYVGKRGGEQPVFLGPGCKSPQITHELMHVLGFHHEQARLDRDKHIQVLWENIDEEFHPQFRKLPWYSEKLSGLPFDYSSIMLYPPTAFSIDGQSYTMIKTSGESYTPGQDLSALDQKRINILYPSVNP